jgi:hypothetical protein
LPAVIDDLTGTLDVGLHNVIAREACIEAFHNRFPSRPERTRADPEEVGRAGRRSLSRCARLKPSPAPKVAATKAKSGAWCAASRTTSSTVSPVA